MIDVRRLTLLRELHDRGTIAAVARALHLTPSAVSQQLAKLARELDTPLLTRHGRQVRLTEQAYLLLDHAAVIDGQLARARADLAAHARGHAGRATLGAFASAIPALVGPVVTVLGAQRPGVRVRIEETEAPGCFAALDTAALDIAVTVDYRGGPPRTDPRYHRQNLLFDPLLLAVPAGHPLAAAGPVDLVDAAAESWIAGAGNGPCGEVVAAACTMAGFTPDVRHRVADWAAALALVAAGAGVALVPRLVLPAAPPGVVVRALSDSRAGRMIYAAVRTGTQHSPTLGTVLSLLGEQARASVGDLPPVGHRDTPAEAVQAAGHGVPEGRG